MNRKINRKQSRRLGVTAVEFAIVAPIIFLLFFGAIEVTRLNFLAHTALNTAYESARVCVVPGSQPSEGVEEGMRLLRAIRIDRGSSVEVTRNSGKVTAVVRIPVSSNSWGLGLFSRNSSIVQRFELSLEIPGAQ